MTLPWWCCCEEEVDCYHEWRPCPSDLGCPPPPPPPPPPTPPPIIPGPPDHPGTRPRRLPGVGPGGGSVSNLRYTPCFLVGGIPGDVWEFGEDGCWIFVRDVDELLGPKLKAATNNRETCKECCLDGCWYQANPCPIGGECDTQAPTPVYVPCDEGTPGDIFKRGEFCYTITDITVTVPPPFISHPTEFEDTCSECCAPDSTCEDCSTDCMSTLNEITSPTLVSNGCGCVRPGVTWPSGLEGEIVCQINFMPGIFPGITPCPDAPEVLFILIDDGAFMNCGAEGPAWRWVVPIQYVSNLDLCNNVVIYFQAQYTGPTGTCPYGQFFFDTIFADPSGDSARFPEESDCCGSYPQFAIASWGTIFMTSN